MTFAIVIATCNRLNQVRSLISQVLRCNCQPTEIIIVDSSDTTSNLLEEQASVKYIHTPHKNQPYQRFIGYTESTSDIIVFLDDDVEILDYGIFDYFLSGYANPKVVGVTVGIDYKNVVAELSSRRPIAKTRFASRLANYFSAFTGAPALRPGRLFLAGLAGGIPIGFEGYVSYFQGANMSFRRNVLEKIFDAMVFGLYAAGLGKGEDKILSMRANRFGLLFANGKLCLKHPPLESHYYQNQTQFSMRATFSRIYLSKVYCEVFKVPWMIGILHFYWFTFWRLLASAIKLASGNKIMSRTLEGQWKGAMLATKFIFHGDRFKKGWSI